MNSVKRILVAPLNWGLGHATRCMPIIHALEKHGAEIILASDGRALALLKNEFPSLKIIELPTYNVKYTTANMFFNIAYQLPKIAWAIQQEQRYIERIIDELNIDAIISDNRFGCRSKRVPSIFISHQLRIKMPVVILENLVAKINHYFIKKFDECWIPDEAGYPNLSARLSHDIFIRNSHFLGVLSRMKFKSVPKKYDAIVVLSGPEPQRSFLEKKIISQLREIPGKYLIVQGKTEKPESVLLENRIEITSFMTAKELNEAILASDVVISRSGYSTLMDLAKLGKKAILIPTPGQTEQEYLATHFKQEKIYYSQQQTELNLRKAFSEIGNYHGLDTDIFNRNKLDEKISSFLNQIK